jgi:hydrogenase expression/formation protein HypE
MLEAGGDDVHTLHDPTRAGLAAALNEIAETAGVAMEVSEREFPRDTGVDGACDILGLDPLQVANEGKLVAIVAPEKAKKVLATMRAHKYGTESAIIGEVLEGPAGRVTLRTVLGTRRIVDPPSGELLPRIC